MGAPIQIYPLYENGFRAQRGQSFDENNQESSQLYANFSEVAAKHPFAWNYGKQPMKAKDIGTVSKINRMICHPCKSILPGLYHIEVVNLSAIDPLYMNAFNTVNMAAACLLTSAGYARHIGISEDKWIYVLGGAGTEESRKCKESSRPSPHVMPIWLTSSILVWERPCYFSSAAISRSIDEGLRVSGLRADEIDVYDFYS